VTTSETNLLQLSDVEVVYGQAILALRGVSLEVARGAIVALLGANGAGKSTTLKAAAGLLRAERGEVTRGTIHYGARDVGRVPARDLVHAGLVQVLEGRHCFPHLTVEENLITGALVKSPARAALKRDLERVYARFPRLRLKRKLPAGYTSGGEQQMIAIGRALMAKPALVLLDEPSMGLAPQVVAEIFEIVRTLHEDDGVSFLLAEQNANLALQYASYAYILENGRVADHGEAAALRAREDVAELYLGMNGKDRVSFRPSRDLQPRAQV